MSDQSSTSEPFDAGAPPTRYERPPAPATRVEGRPAGVTRAEGGGSFATRREGRRPVSQRGRVMPSLVGLPQALASRFERIGSIGHGGQAHVLLCREVASGRQVSIKLYLNSAAGLDEGIINLVRTADPAHVVPLYEVGDDDQNFWEIQEYFAGGTLADLIVERPGPWPEAEVRGVLSEVSEALASVHAQKLIHRDLKPGNVFVRSLEPLDLVLGDFGLAHELLASAQLMSVAGTFAYMPPEAVRYGETSIESDWWALGVIVHQLFTGHHLVYDPADPMLMMDEHIVRKAISESQYEFADLTDPRWRLLITGLLTRSRRHRWGAEQVRAWLAGGSPAVHTEKAAPAVTTLGSLAFLGAAYSEPEQVAQAIRDDSDGARDYLTSPAAADLRRWLRGTWVGDAAEPVFNDLAEHRTAVASALVELQLILGAGAAPSFEGRTLTAASLAQAATAGLQGDEQDQAWIKRLRTNRILSLLHRYTPGEARMGLADEHLRMWHTAVQGLLPKLASAEKSLAEKSTGQREALLLAAALSSRSRDDLLATAAGVGFDGYTAPQSLVDLVQAAKANDVPAAALALALVPAWVNAKRLSEDEAKRAADLAIQQQRQREREAEEARAAATLRQQAEAQQRSLRAARQAIGRRVGANAVPAVVAGAMLFSTGQPTQTSVLIPAIILASVVACLFVIDIVLHEQAGSTASWLGAGVGALDGLSRLVAGVTATGYLLPAALTYPALGMVAGYTLGGLGRFLLTRLPLRPDRGARLNFWTALPMLGTPIVLLGMLAANSTLDLLEAYQTFPSWYITLVNKADALFPDIPLTSTGQLNLLIWAAALLAVFVVGNQDQLGRLTRPVGYPLIGGAGALGLLSVFAAPLYFFVPLFYVGIIALIIGIILAVFSMFS